MVDDRIGWVALIEAVRLLPYGRPSDGSVDGMLREGRGTCSTKHRYLARELKRRWAVLEPRLVHRVYRVDRAAAAHRFGDAVGAVVPPEGLVDVHRYLTIVLGTARLVAPAAANPALA